MIAFWIGMFAVVMLFLMCFEPRGGGHSTKPSDSDDPGLLPKVGGQSK